MRGLTTKWPILSLKTLSNECDFTRKSRDSQILNLNSKNNSNHSALLRALLPAQRRRGIAGSAGGAFEGAVAELGDIFVFQTLMGFTKITSYNNNKPPKHGMAGQIARTLMRAGWVDFFAVKLNIFRLCKIDILTESKTEFN